VAAGLWLWVKGIAVAAGLGISGFVAVTHVVPALRRSGPAELSSARSSAHRDVAVAPAMPPAVAMPVATAAPSASAIATRSTTPTTPTTRTTTPTANVEPQRAPASAAPSEDSLEREAAILEQARAAMEHDPGEAIAKLDSHASAFPRGELSIERELLAVDALRRLRRFAEARTRAEALLVQARGSIYEERVRGMLQSLR
jgi:hypothetical protein